MFLGTNYGAKAPFLFVIMKISVIVSTYNNPAYLNLVLHSLISQTDTNYEVVVADDGSSEETRQLVHSIANKSAVPVIHAWQEDLGFRLAASRNNGFRHATGDYFVFIDGDCIVRENFVARHRLLSEKGYFVTGNRILLSENFSKAIVERKDFLPHSIFDALNALRKKKINRILPLLYLPEGVINRKKNDRWQKLRGCNFAVWKEDLLRTNGFNEDFVGWGFEDSEFAVRILNAGIHRKSGNFATGVFHLYHKELKVPQEGPNWERLQFAIKEHLTRCPNGIEHLESS